MHAFDLSSEDDAVLADARQGDLRELVDGVCAEELERLFGQAGELGDRETIPRSMPGTSGAPYTPPVATMTASGFMARTKSGVTVVLVLMVSPGVFLA